MDVSTAESSHVTTPIPEVRFQAPDLDAAEMSIAEYRRAVAECVVLAAKKNPPMIEPQFRYGRPGVPPRPLTDLSNAILFVQQLEESDLNRREWMCVEGYGDWVGLTPELNYCIQALRDMRKVAHLARLGAEHLAVLRGTITTHNTVPDVMHEQVD